ncbi:hypothetical protein A8B78_07445 [Jannaschia sp. EhC01]|nr:hypothetical protein A8B78_07445 [Jannaschia sp. EhC01]
MVTITAPSAATGSYYAGGFNLSADGGTTTFVSWCIDIFDNLTNGDSYSVEATAPQVSSTEQNWLSELFDDVANPVANAIQSAAFQLAIWEIVFEGATAEGDLDVTNGSFAATAANNTVLTTANAFLADLSGKGGLTNFTFLLSENGGQDQLTTSGNPSLPPVPLPAGGLLLLGGLGALAIARRKRKAA